MSYYSSVDETYISLLDLIPVTEETIKITIDRLFSPPTCRNLKLPFVHTPDSWRASLIFLSSLNAFSILNSLLSSLPQNPTTYMKLSDDFSYKGRSGIANLGSTCYVSSLLQILNVFSNVSMKLIHKESDYYTPFVAFLRYLLAELKFVRGKLMNCNYCC